VRTFSATTASARHNCVVLVVGWIGAIVCCLGYGVGSVLQSVGARRVAPITGAAGLVGLLSQGPYLLGLVCDALGFAGNVVAARQLPLFLVQTIMAASVAVTAIVAALRGDRLHAWEWAAVGVLTAGLCLLGIGAQTGPATNDPSGLDWIVLASCLLPIVLGRMGTRLEGTAAWVVLALAAGSGFGVVAVAARGLSEYPVNWRLILQPLSWALVIAGVAAIATFAAALQRGPVTSVTAINVAVEMIGPAIVGIAVLGDGVAAGWGAAAVVGFLLVVSGSAGLVRRA
jgi:hypothetical protein